MEKHVPQQYQTNQISKWQCEFFFFFSNYVSAQLLFAAREAKRPDDLGCLNSF